MKWFVRILLSLVLIVIIAISVVLGFIVTPEMLTPKVVSIAQQYIKSDLSVKSVDITLLSRFPNITLKIDSLQITQLKDSIGDLVIADRCRISVDPFALLNQKVVVNHLSLEGAKIYMYVDEQVSPIQHFDLGDSTEVKPQTDSLTMAEKMKDYTFELKRFEIDSTQIIIDDRLKQFYTRVDNFNVDMALKFSSSKSELDVDLDVGNLLVWRKGEVLVKKTSLAVKSDVDYDRDSLMLTFNKALMKVNGIGLKADGTLQADTVNNCLLVDVNTSLRTPSLSEFLALATDAIIDDKEKITTSGKVSLDTKITGKYSDSQMPNLDMKLKVEDGTAKYDSRKVSLEQVDCDADLFINLNRPSRSYANIRRFHVNTSGIVDLTLSGKVLDLIENPSLDVNINSDIDFDRFLEIFPLKNGVAFSGKSKSDLQAQFTVQDIQNSDYAKLYLDGESQFSDVNISIDGKEFSGDSTSTGYFFLEAKTGKLLFGDKVRTDNDSRTLLANIDLEGVGMKDKDGNYIMVKNMQLSAGANFDKTTSKMNGVGIRTLAQNTNMGVDSLFDSNLEFSDVMLTISPKNEERNTKIVAKVSSQTIEATEFDNNSDMSLSSVDMELDLLKNDAKDWSMTGFVSFSDLNLYTDLFPLKLGILETRVSVANNRVTLDNAQLTVGESQIVATGYIENVIRRLFLEQKVRVAGELSVRSPLLNITEIIEATNKSVMMTELAADELASDSTLLGDSTQILASTAADTVSQILLVPRGVSFVFDLNVDKVAFEESTINNVVGRATIGRDGLNLSDFSMTAIGATAKGNMMYSNIGRDSARLSLYMNLTDVDINRIGELAPSLDAMMPMLKSFEGIVDFDLKAKTNLFGDSQIDVNTLRSAMSFKGKNLVLMDSETFDSVSKVLMFKNKDENLIDSLGVYAVVDKAQVDVLPFEVSIDRYKAVVGGSQIVDYETFDVDYEYNISILKSPLPFKAGVDLKGNLKDFEYDVTKAKLKNTDFDEQRKIYEDFRDAIILDVSDTQERPRRSEDNVQN